MRSSLNSRHDVPSWSSTFLTGGYTGYSIIKARFMYRGGGLPVDAFASGVFLIVTGHDSLKLPNFRFSGMEQRSPYLENQDHRMHTRCLCHRTRGFEIPPNLNEGHCLWNGSYVRPLKMHELQTHGANLAEASGAFTLNSSRNPAR